MEKRGEVTTKQIVTLIIIIVSFVIIVFFLFRLDLGRTTEKEVCHNSVLMRGAAGVPEDAVPLNCKTSYVCLSKDGKCDKMADPIIEKVKSKEEVYGVLANEMADCWWMFGEGKINYVGKEFNRNLYCSICSQVAFDDSIDFFEEGSFSESELYVYMENNNAPGKEISYLEYLQGSNAEEIRQAISEESLAFQEIDISSYYYVMTGAFSEASRPLWTLVGAGIGVVGAVALIPITGGASIAGVVAITKVVSGIAGGSAIGYYIGSTRQGESGLGYMAPVIVEIDPETFEALECKDITTLS